MALERVKKVLVDGVPYRSALGKMCLICWNVFRLAGLEEQHGSLRKYLEWKSTGIERHHAFMRVVEAWIAKHNENPNKARLRMHNELDGVLHICVVQSSGLRQETKYDFVELAGTPWPGAPTHHRYGHIEAKR